ncbi:trichohyalin-like [Microplitis mediator]|uniref:trichohyalin-like n=1 Tax=Microplitis mediator TaxID=375433 RepID=UPI002552EEBC|nr:trichohyalin-like [Microplitis mediator]
MSKMNTLVDWVSVIDRLKIIDLKNSGVETKTITDEFKITEDTLQEIMKNEDKYKSLKESFLVSFSKIKEMISIAPGYKELEQNLLTWLSEVRSHGLGLDSITFQRKAMDLYDKMGPTFPFRASHKWVRYFEKCHNIEVTFGASENNMTVDTLFRGQTDSDILNNRAQEIDEEKLEATISGQESIINKEIEELDELEIGEEVEIVEEVELEEEVEIEEVAVEREAEVDRELAVNQSNISGTLQNFTTEIFTGSIIILTICQNDPIFYQVIEEENKREEVEKPCEENEELKNKGIAEEALNNRSDLIDLSENCTEEIDTEESIFPSMSQQDFLINLGIEKKRDEKERKIKIEDVEENLKDRKDEEENFSINLLNFLDDSEISTEEIDRDKIIISSADLQMFIKQVIENKDEVDREEEELGDREVGKGCPIDLWDLSNTSENRTEAMDNEELIFPSTSQQVSMINPNIEGIDNEEEEERDEDKEEEFLSDVSNEKRTPENSTVEVNQEELMSSSTSQQVSVIHKKSEDADAVPDSHKYFDKVKENRTEETDNETLIFPSTSQQVSKINPNIEGIDNEEKEERDENKEEFLSDVSNQERTSENSTVEVNQEKLMSSSTSQQMSVIHKKSEDADAVPDSHKYFDKDEEDKFPSKVSLGHSILSTEKNKILKIGVTKMKIIGMEKRKIMKKCDITDRMQKLTIKIQEEDKKDVNIYSERTKVNKWAYRNSLIKELEENMLTWLIDARNKGILVNGRKFRNKALQFHQELGMKYHFRASYHWINAFEKRHRIKIIKKKKKSNVRAHRPLRTRPHLPRMSKRRVENMMKNQLLLPSTGQDAPVLCQEEQDKTAVSYECGNEELERRLLIWLNEVQDQKQSRNGLIFKRKAMEIYEELGGKFPFKPTYDWVSSFEIRHNVEIIKRNKDSEKDIMKFNLMRNQLNLWRTSKKLAVSKGTFKEIGNTDEIREEYDENEEKYEEIVEKYGDGSEQEEDKDFENGEEEKEAEEEYVDDGEQEEDVYAENSEEEKDTEEYSTNSEEDEEEYVDDGEEEKDFEVEEYVYDKEEEDVYAENSEEEKETEEEYSNNSEEEYFDDGEEEKDLEVEEYVDDEKEEDVYAENSEEEKDTEEEYSNNSEEEYVDDGEEEKDSEVEEYVDDEEEETQEEYVDDNEEEKYQQDQRDNDKNQAATDNDDGLSCNLSISELQEEEQTENEGYEEEDTWAHDEDSLVSHGEDINGNILQNTSGNSVMSIMKNTEETLSRQQINRKEKRTKHVTFDINNDPSDALQPTVSSSTRSPFLQSLEKFNGIEDYLSILKYQLIFSECKKMIAKEEIAIFFKQQQIEDLKQALDILIKTITSEEELLNQLLMNETWAPFGRMLCAEDIAWVSKDRILCTFCYEDTEDEYDNYHRSAIDHKLTSNKKLKSRICGNCCKSTLDFRPAAKCTECIIPFWRSKPYFRLLFK